MKYKTVKLIVVARAYTGAKPNTVMVEFYNTIVADIAVRTARRSENIASFTKFLLVQIRRTSAQNLRILDSS